MAAADLPHVDEHSIAVSAEPEQLWDAVVEVAWRSFAGGASARMSTILGSSERAASGQPGEVGSTLPGFRVESAQPPATLLLAGGHRFSRYALIFRIEPAGAAASRLTAETRAEFPGLHGRAYRALVIGTRLHVRVVRRMLAAAKRRAERATSG